MIAFDGLEVRVRRDADAVFLAADGSWQIVVAPSGERRRLPDMIGSKNHGLLRGNVAGDEVEWIRDDIDVRHVVVVQRSGHGAAVRRVPDTERDVPIV